MPFCVLTSCSARKELPKCRVFIPSAPSVCKDTAVSHAWEAYLHSCFTVSQNVLICKCFPQLFKQFLGQNNGASVF